MVVDPVIPAALNGLKVEMTLAGRPVEVTYHISGKGCGPVSINLNGVNLHFSRDHNAYRPGAARILKAVWKEHLKGERDILIISLA